MPLYEHVFIARQDLAQAQVDALAETATNIIETAGGKVVKTETWGLRSLAYRIAKNRKGHYVMLEFDAPAAAVAELYLRCLAREPSERERKVCLEHIVVVGDRPAAFEDLLWSLLNSEELRFRN